MRAVAPQLAEQAYFGYSLLGGSWRRQCGAVRTNCLDCLVRTNMMQMAIGFHAVEEQLHQLRCKCGLPVTLPAEQAELSRRVQGALGRIWALTGDSLSVQYTGTANLSKGSGIGEARAPKGSIGRALGFVEKGVRTVNRYMHEHLLEDVRHASIGSLLGGGPPRMRRTASAAEGEVPFRTLLLCCGSWNVGGKLPTEQDLMCWLASAMTSVAPVEAPAGAAQTAAAPDLFVISLQEFVDFNAQNLLRADEERRRECAARTARVITRLGGESKKYHLVQSEGLVGLLLLVFAEQSVAETVSHVSTANVKTGFGGNAGNKGAVAVRFSICGAELCVINVHLPAGEKAGAADERVAAAADILKGLQGTFSAARNGPFPPPLEHHLCIFMGDLNFRLELPNEQVRERVCRHELGLLQKSDQLLRVQRAGCVLSEFEEAPVTFPPTYKYDPGTSRRVALARFELCAWSAFLSPLPDFVEHRLPLVHCCRYDTSDKQRVPSWTDRILWGDGAEIVAEAYTACSRVDASDHKPVAALLRWLPSRLPLVDTDNAEVADGSLSCPPRRNPCLAGPNSLIDFEDPIHKVAASSRATSSLQPVLPQIDLLLEPLTELQGVSLENVCADPRFQPGFSPGLSPGLSSGLTAEDFIAPPWAPVPTAVVALGVTSAARSSFRSANVNSAFRKWPLGQDLINHPSMGGSAEILPDWAQDRGGVTPPPDWDLFQSMVIDAPAPSCSQSGSCSSCSLLD